MFPIIYNYYIEHFHIKIMLFEHVLTEIVVAEKKIKIRIRPFRPDFRSKLWDDELCLKNRMPHKNKSYIHNYFYPDRSVLLK